ncbi:hypothetical protein ID866_9339 [Astraeus odoratus]|nr:hypothetical protein ID866_9339 [Astraeus odoratus]
MIHFQHSMSISMHIITPLRSQHKAFYYL